MHVKFFRMEEATDGTSGGSGAGGGAAQGAGKSILAGAGGAGGSSDGAGAGSNTVQDDKKTAEGAGAGGSKISFPENWKEGLPEEFRNEASLKLINDIPTLAKSYVSAQKMVGADKIQIPGKHATEDDWKAVYAKLGLPAKVEEYELKIGEKSSLEKGLVEEFKKSAHAAGVLPKQAQALLEWFDGTNAKNLETLRSDQEKKLNEGLEGLKKEWGEAFNAKTQRAAALIRENADESFLKHLDETGLGNDPKLIQFMAKLADQFMSEDKIKSDPKFGSNIHSPAEAREKYDSLLRDFKGPYYDGNHPNHKQAVQEAQKLFQMAYPSQS